MDRYSCLSRRASLSVHDFGKKGSRSMKGAKGRSPTPLSSSAPTNRSVHHARFQAFHMAQRTIQGFQAMLWLHKGFGIASAWTVCEQNRLLALCFGLPQVNNA